MRRTSSIYLLQKNHSHTVDAFRVKVLNYYIENFDTHASFMPKEEKSFMVFNVGYIPEGYMKGDEFKSASSYALTYYNQENNMIAITLYDSETVFNGRYRKL